jgi:hypothetical protein
LYLRSPLIDNIVGVKSGNTNFANEKYVASLLHPDVITSLILKISDKTDLSEVFYNLPEPRDIQKMGNLMYSTLLFINLYEYMNSTFDEFSSTEAYIKLFHFLNKALDGEKIPMIPTFHLYKSNMAYICRLMFRALDPSLGIMIPEGNGRNYSACSALARCRIMNVFINKPFEESKSLDFPNLLFIKNHISCDYVVHKHKSSSQSSTPYGSAIRIGYFQLSIKSYNNSNASQKIHCHNFAETFFRQKIDPSLVNNVDLTPLEIREFWPMSFKEDCRRFLINKTKERTRENWMDLAKYSWLSMKKKEIFVELCAKKDLMDVIQIANQKLLPKLKNNPNDDSYDEMQAVAENLLVSMTDNIKTNFFDPMNIPRCLSLLLSGLACYKKDMEHSVELMKELRTFIFTNGVSSNSDIVLTNDWTRKLQCAWLPKESRESMTDNKIYSVSTCPS